MNVNFINKSQAVNLVDEGDIPKTKNFGIELMEPNERANYLNKWNNAMNNIDENMGLLQAVGSSSVLKIENLETRVGKNETAITELQNAGSSTSLKVDNLYQTVGSLSTLLADTVGSVSYLKTTTSNNVKNINELQKETAKLFENVGSLSTLVNAAAGDIENLWSVENSQETKINNHYGDYQDTYTPQQNNSNGAISKKVDSLNTDVANLADLVEPEKIQSLQTQVNTNTTNITDHWGTNTDTWEYSNPTNRGIAKLLNFPLTNLGKTFLTSTNSANINVNSLNNSIHDPLDYILVLGTIINKSDATIYPVTLLFPVPRSGRSDYTKTYDAGVHVTYSVYSPEHATAFTFTKMASNINTQTNMLITGLYGVENNNVTIFSTF